MFKKSLNSNCLYTHAAGQKFTAIKYSSTWILPHETSGAAKVLPRQRGVPVVVVGKHPVQSAGPLDGVDDLGVAVKHVGRHVDGADAGVDRDPGEVLVLLKRDTRVSDPEPRVPVRPVRGREVPVPRGLLLLQIVVTVVRNVDLE